MSPPGPHSAAAAALPAHRARVERARLAALDRDYARWHSGRDAAQRAGSAAVLACAFLVERIAAAEDEIRRLRGVHASFVRQLGQPSSTPAAQAVLLLNQARALGARGNRLAGDQRALARDFGADALNERCQRRIAQKERELCLAAALLGVHGAAALGGLADDEAGAARRWRRTGIEAGLRSLLSYEGNTQVRLDAFRGLATALAALPPALHAHAVSASTTQFVFRLAQEPRQEIWLQCEALALLARVSPEIFASVVRRRLGLPVEGDDCFVRRRCVALVAASLFERPEWAELLQPATGDPAPFVRQGLAEALPTMPPEAAARSLARLLADREPAVQAQALLALPTMLAALGGSWFSGILEALLASRQPPFTLRTALLVAERGFAAAVDAGHPTAGWGPRLLAAADRLASAADDLRVRQWAAECAEWLRVQLDPQERTLCGELSTCARSCGAGSAMRLPEALADLSGERLGRLAQVLARRDFGLHFERHWGRWRLHRGHRFGFRLWRLLHELRHPSPDKRQAFRHTLGRLFRGSVHAPSAILAELSETKVPGEPLQQAAEAGWRPWLPLPDQLISCLDEPQSSGPLQIHCAFGVTWVRPPASLAARFVARQKLTARFAHFAALRNWQDDGRSGPDAYVRALRTLGFALDFMPYAGRQANPAVQRFFAVSLPGGASDLWQRLQAYFFSAYENTLYELALFVVLALSGFTGRHIIANRQLRLARAALPLVIGGWGTRGKSGTERLKAALFNALGYSVVSKTTGCEAMFLHGVPFQPLREMFLFRPYDKATIWEQHHLTCMAARLGADVMLWECMALTPAFVKLLQKRWMRDDLATITNTFPDHEDIQGPAGVNIPEVMTHFIPDRSTLITSEEQMRPILAAAADRAGTRLIGVGWLESGLITPDVLARFPYQEHPDNIALVLRMAAELGIPGDFAIREMADRVVPDLGVLKVFATAPVDGRRLSFANGMSANERFGCLGNWTRLGFDRADHEAEPDLLVSTVVNNRADRIARSRVFAGILVDDLRADLHFLIGSNLEGLTGYIREAWDARAASLTLAPESGEDALTVLAAEARRLRMVRTPERVQARLAAMLAGCAADPALVASWDDPAALEAALHGPAGEARAAVIRRFLEADLAQLAEYRAFAERLASPGTAATSLDEEFRALLWRAFERKLVVVWDYHASGNRVIQTLAEHTPPGCHNRIMGIQNIKGTGLDFVYRWLAWERCERACRQLASSESASLREGLRALADFHEFGLLGEDTLRRALATARAAPVAQSEQIQAELRLLEARHEQTIAEIRGGLARVHRAGRLEQAVRTVEGFVDAGDALWRRRRAQQIYRDLMAERIGSARAAAELMGLTQRQKGGWLYHTLIGRLRLLQDGLAELLARGLAHARRVAAWRSNFGRAALRSVRPPPKGPSRP